MTAVARVMLEKYSPGVSMPGTINTVYVPYVRDYLFLRMTLINGDEDYFDMVLDIMRLSAMTGKARPKGRPSKASAAKLKGVG